MMSHGNTNNHKLPGHVMRTCTDSCWQQLTTTVVSESLSVLAHHLEGESFIHEMISCPGSPRST
jgi:hypothetical protein